MNIDKVLFCVWLFFVIISVIGLFCYPFENKEEQKPKKDPYREYKDKSNFWG